MNMPVHSHEKKSIKILKLTSGLSSNVTILKHPADEKDSKSDGASKFDGNQEEGGGESEKQQKQNVFCRLMTKTFKYKQKIWYIGHRARTNKVRSVDIAQIPTDILKQRAHILLSECSAEKWATKFCVFTPYGLTGCTDSTTPVRGLPFTAIWLELPRFEAILRHRQSKSRRWCAILQRK